MSRLSKKEHHEGPRCPKQAAEAGAPAAAPRKGRDSAGRGATDEGVAVDSVALPAPFAGADWLEQQGKELSDHGRRVADIVGAVYRGIYHIERPVLRADWSDPLMVELVLPGELATFDFPHLTELLVLCHDACIRLSISPYMRNLRLMFHPRQGRTGRMSKRHPTIEDATRYARELYDVPRGHIE